MRQDVPSEEARRQRPETVFRYTFEHFARFGVPLPQKDRLPDARERCVVPLEAVAAGDVQVLAPRVPGNDKYVADLDPLADFPSVESVIASSHVRASRPLPSIREYLVGSFAEFPSAATLRLLPGLQSLFANHLGYAGMLDLDALPAAQMRELAVNRWKTVHLSRLQDMTGLVWLSIKLFREPLDPIAGMSGLRFLVVGGPARGWAQLRECTQLESAAFSEVQIANLKRWNTWTSLRELALNGRGLKSLAGIQSMERLEYLSLCNLRMADLAPLAELRALSSLVLRMPGGPIDLDSIVRMPSLKTFVIDESVVTDRDVVKLPSLRPLAAAQTLEELTLLGVHVEDGDLSTLAELPHLRRVRLGQDIGADVEKLRAARPELEIHYTPPPARNKDLEEQVGSVTIHRPGEGIEQWWIFDNLADVLKTSTNYAAEKRIRAAVKQQDRELAARLDWDTEAGAVGIYARDEADMRRVAAIINGLIASTSQT